MEQKLVQKNYPHLESTGYYKNRTGLLINDFYTMQSRLILHSPMLQGKSANEYLKVAEEYKKEHLSIEQGEEFLNEINTVLEKYFPAAESFCFVLDINGYLNMNVKVKERISDSEILNRSE